MTLLKGTDLVQKIRTGPGTKMCNGTGPCSYYDATRNVWISGSLGRFSLGNYGLATLLEIAQPKEENLVCTPNVV